MYAHTHARLIHAVEMTVTLIIFRKKKMLLGRLRVGRYSVGDTEVSKDGPMGLS